MFVVLVCGDERLITEPRADMKCEEKEKIKGIENITASP